MSARRRRGLTMHNAANGSLQPAPDKGSFKTGKNPLISPKIQNIAGISSGNMVCYIQIYGTQILLKKGERNHAEF